MHSANTTKVLNELLVLHSRSLASYLGDAALWTAAGEKSARQKAFERLAASHHTFADRFTTLIFDRRGRIDSGQFPMSFTGLHMLSLEYLAGVLIKEQQRLIAAIETRLPLLQDDAAARELAEESLGAARGHLEALQEAGAASRGESTVKLHDRQG